MPSLEIKLSPDPQFGARRGERRYKAETVNRRAKQARWTKICGSDVYKLNPTAPIGASDFLVTKVKRATKLQPP
jgi:hypothetical protein